MRTPDWLLMIQSVHGDTDGFPPAIGLRASVRAYIVVDA